MYDKANEGGSGAEWRLTDGNFDLRCLMMNGLDKHALTFSGANWVRKGYGPLDLSTKMVNSQDGSEVVITAIWWSQLGSINAPRADFTHVVVPRTLTSLYTTSFRDQTNLVEVVIDCPDLTTMGNCVFTRDTNLKRLVFKAPKLEKITEKYLFFKAMMTETDATDWDLSSLKTLSKGGESRFSLAELTDGYGFHGTLCLPSLETTGWGDFYYQQHVTNVVLGTKKGSLSLLSGCSFNQNKGLASLTIGCTETLEVAQDAFGNCPNLKSVTFVKHIPPQAAMDAILVNSSDKNRASVYVSPARSQWTGFLKEIDETKDPNAPAGAVGVYETAEGVRKAWVFYKESPLDPKGAYIILR